MSTQTHPTSRPHRTPEPTMDATKRRPAGRTIVASVVAGAVAALVLALVVFAGGTEATITGALLLGFGFGWALMATLTVRRTRQPQRWAVVPAVAMGATGAALVVFTPGNQTITALNWVWPPLMVALTVWMFVQMRRSVTGKSRWVVTPVIAVLALASIGATYDNIARTVDQATFAAPGKLYDVGGHRLHLDCQGHGSPTVVLSNWLGGVSAGLGADHRTGRRDHPGLRLRPRRTGLERRGRKPPRRRRVGRGSAHAPRRGRRAGPVRAGRALHRRDLRDDVRGPLPRAGRRPGAAGQLQPRAVHPDARLPRPVRHDAPRSTAWCRR